MRLTTRLLTTRVMTTRLVASCCVWSALCGGVPLAAQDTIRVRSTAAPRWGADVKLTQVWAIGQVDGPDDIAFGRVDNATVDARGRMYVYDSNDGQIRQYAPDGKFVRNIGRKGKGPGEYEWVFGMDIADDSLLTTFDLNNARVSYFAPDGKLRTVYRPASHHRRHLRGRSAAAACVDAPTRRAGDRWMNSRGESAIGVDAGTARRRFTGPTAAHHSRRAPVLPADRRRRQQQFSSQSHSATLAAVLETVTPIAS
jgi:hypothetical protein